MEPDKKRNLIFILTICSTSVYLIWRVFGTIPMYLRRSTRR